MANGLYTNSELIDTLINDLNEAIKSMAGGQALQACIIVSGMTQKLTNLRKTIDNDLKSRDQTIETLKKELRAAGREVIDMTPDQFIEECRKDGINNGSN